ncbi:hypothetical protein [Streptomyces huasconensis]|uniref:hypothetical protein n=1 Tax=Streptomyces huasconensis TaxID=1854574 RepID=UPI0033D6A929
MTRERYDELVKLGRDWVATMSSAQWRIGDAGRAPGPQRGLEGGDGRGHTRVVLAAERLPVAGELAQRAVGAVHRDDEPGRGSEFGVGEVEAARQFLSEAGQGVVDAGDVPAVGHGRQALGPQVGDPPGVEDQGVGALVEELGGQGAQHGGAAAAGGGADQDMRAFGVQVDGDGAAVGADAYEGAPFGQRLYPLAQVGGGEAEHRRERVLRHGGGVPALCGAW